MPVLADAFLIILVVAIVVLLCIDTSGMGPPTVKP